MTIETEEHTLRQILEPMADTSRGIDGLIKASVAISLKRIADKMQPAMYSQPEGYSWSDLPMG